MSLLEMARRDRIALPTQRASALRDPAPCMPTMPLKMTAAAAASHAANVPPSIVDAQISEAESLMHSTHALSACQRCKRRKNRCTMELPSCFRCRKSGDPCVYPEEPYDMEEFVQTFMQRISQTARRMRELESKLAATSPRISQIQSLLVLHQFALQHHWRLIPLANGLRIHTNLRSVADLFRFIEHQLMRFGFSGERLFCNMPRRYMAAGRLSQTYLRHYGNLSTQLTRKQRLAKLDLAHLVSSYKSALDSFIYTFDDCSIFYQSVDRAAFIDDYRSGRMDPLLKWSVWMWMAHHVYFQHPNSDPSYLFLADIAHEKTVELMRERFDMPSLATVMAHVFLFLANMYEGKDTDHINLAIQHLEILRVKYENPSNSHIDARSLETFRRVAWAVYLVHRIKTLFLFGPGRNDIPVDTIPLVPEPRRMPHEALEIDAYVSFITNTMQMTGMLLSEMRLRSGYPSEEEFAAKMERKLKDCFAQLPSYITQPRSNVRFAARSLSEYEMALCQVYFPLLPPLTSSPSQVPSISPRSPPAPAPIQQRALDLCSQATRRSLATIKGLLQHKCYCQMYGLFPHLKMAFLVQSRVFFLSTSPVERVKAIESLHLCLSLIRTCASCLRVPAGKSLLQQVEEFFVEHLSDHPVCEERMNLES
ncbi:uncharacterized protein VTP21DRAFT_3560 [Calcarisporiella thermophila]|uniref:uncharacterized protein n=1 Tax=Calcarisporiella thermophila TaxID=911321 RepID=UPI00374294C8